MRKADHFILHYRIVCQSFWKDPKVVDEGGIMKRLLSAALLAAAMSSAAYADTIKVGIVGPFSGPFALQGKNFKAGIDAYVAINGHKVGNHEVEIIYRDVPQADPAQSKALAQELIVKEGVQYLGGFYFTPDAMAATPLLQQANVPMVVMNAAASAIVTKSPYVVRTSFTIWQTVSPMAQVAFDDGAKKVVTVVADYAPGHDAEAAFKAGFEKAGGAVVEQLRMPMSTADFSPIMQRIKDSGADGLFVFLPSGPPTLGFVKAYNENGLKAAGIKFFAPGDLTQESDLPALGESALGLQTTFHYAVSHDSPENKAFVTAASKAIGNQAELSFPAVGAYDGMHVIYKMIEATGGKQDAEKAVGAVKGLSWTSPRGPVSIDPESRHIVENIYLREVTKAADGTYYNKEIRTFEKQGDPGLAAKK
jgi:branched-chain amino acid transport system substrate-binding protein